MTEEQFAALKAAAPKTPDNYTSVRLTTSGRAQVHIGDILWTLEEVRDELLPWLQYWVAQAISRETSQAVSEG